MDKDSRTRAYVRQLSPNTNYQPAVPYPFAYIYIYTCSIDRKVITGAVSHSALLLPLPAAILSVFYWGSTAAV